METTKSIFPINFENLRQKPLEEFKIAMSEPDRETAKRLFDLLSPESEERQLVANLLKRDILYIGAENENLSQIDIEEEAAEIGGLVKNELLSFHSSSKSDLDTIMSEWDKVKPEIVIISAHGNKTGLFLNDDNGETLHYSNTDFYNFFKKRSVYTECLILSACESLTLGELLLDNCKHVICVNQKVNIETTRKFNLKFVEYLNTNADKEIKIYRDAFDRALESITYKKMKNTFSFKFLETDKIL